QPTAPPSMSRTVDPSLGRQTLRNLRALLAPLLDRRPDDAPGSERLGLLGELVEAAPGKLGAGAQPAHDATRFERAREDLELRSRERLAEVVDLHARSTVGRVAIGRAHV